MSLKSSYKKVLTGLLFFTSLSIISISCDSTEPTDNLKPGRRDYIWKVDTLNTQVNRIQSIWGSSPGDVWAVGPGGLTAFDGLWHFDGNIWQPFSEALLITPACIYGFAQNNVWMGGSDGKIFHFNGSVWNQNYMFWNDSIYTTYVTNICGSSPNNIYAVGTIFYSIDEQAKSFILHYDGKNWSPIYITSEYVQFLEIDLDGYNVYIYGYTNPTDSTLASVSFYKMENNRPTKIFQKSTNEVTWATPCNIGGNTYFLIEKKLISYSKGEFINLITFNSDNFNYYVSGRNLKDIFLHNRDGLAHYNGEDIKYLYYFSNNFTSNYHKPMLFEKDVFFTVYDNLNDYSIILHGKFTD